MWLEEPPRYSVLVFAELAAKEHRPPELEGSSANRDSRMRVAPTPVMNEQQTCGKGLAEHSTLPAKLAELVSAMVENLEIHQTSLDLTDENARKELDAYVKLAKEFRDIAARLQATAEHMAGYRNLPMGRHDRQALAGPKVVKAFETFVRLERELLALLQSSVERDQKMLSTTARRS